MQIFIGSAKTMSEITPRLITGCTDPAFQRNADSIALYLARYSAAELQSMLKCSQAIAKECWRRYHRFLDPVTRRPAIFSYDGTVYKKIDPATFTDADLAYANSHLLIGSMLYGVLRPLDMINMYRLEGNVTLPGTGYIKMTDYWKPILTQWLIDTVKADDGVLINLASNEFTEIFDWKRVCAELQVVTPTFRVDQGGKLRTVVVYAKMCRGAMARWLLLNRTADVAALRDFAYDGFAWTSDWNYTLK